MTDIPCRRCGGTAGDMTKLWKAGPGGALAPYAAQHRAPCASPAPPPPRIRRRDRLNVITASRPGKCAACERDVVPGDKAVNTDAGLVHLECAPGRAAAS